MSFRVMMSTLIIGGLLGEYIHYANDGTVHSKIMSLLTYLISYGVVLYISQSVYDKWVK